MAHKKKKKQVAAKSGIKKSSSASKATKKQVTKKAAQKGVAKKAVKTTGRGTSAITKKKASVASPKPTLLSSKASKAKKALPEVQPVKAPEPRKKMSKRQEEALEKISQMSLKWSALYKKSKNLEALPYNMRHSYEPKTAIVHKILGWGFILNNKNDRLEVLFKDGVKTLISNYRS